MATISAWTLQNTNAIGIHVQTDRKADLYESDRLVAHLQAGSNTVIDPYAPFDTLLSYKCENATITTRRTPPGEVTAGDLLISDTQGRGTWVRHRDKGDPARVETQVKRFTTISATRDVVRFPANLPASSGTIDIYAPTSETATSALSILSTPGVVVLATGRPVPGVPGVRVIIVESVDTTRVTPWGGRFLTIRYEDATGTTNGIIEPNTGGLATYEDARRYQFTYGSGSYLDAVRIITGARL